MVDSQGHAVNKATVQISQTKHAFLFGCNFFGLNPADTSPTQTAYQNEFASLFNYATLPFYWGSFEPQQGQKNYAQLDAMANWCEAHGITSKGHPLVWHQVWPSWAPTDPDAASPLIQARITDLITHYGKTVHYWDVVNEANGAADFTPANGESNWISRDGPDSL